MACRRLRTYFPGKNCTRYRFVPFELVVRGNKMGGILWTIIVILFVLWLIGFLMHVGGGLIHILLVIAIIVLIVNLLTGRRTV